MNPLGIRGLALTADEESQCDRYSRQAMPQCKVQQLAIRLKSPPLNVSIFVSCALLRFAWQQISDHWVMVRATRVENMVEAATVTPTVEKLPRNAEP